MSGLGTVLHLAAAAASTGDTGGDKVAIHVLGLDLTGFGAAVTLIAGVLGLLATLWRIVGAVSAWRRPIEVRALAWPTTALKKDGTRRPATHVDAYVHNRTRAEQTPTLRIVKDPGWWKRSVPGWRRRLDSAGKLQVEAQQATVSADAWARVDLVVLHEGSDHPAILVTATATPHYTAAVAPDRSSAAIGVGAA